MSQIGRYLPTQVDNAYAIYYVGLGTGGIIQLNTYDMWLMLTESIALLLLHHFEAQDSENDVPSTRYQYILFDDVRRLSIDHC